MMQSVKKLFSMAEGIGLQEGVGGAFGAYGWSGEAPEEIFNAMKNILKMDMVSGSLKLEPVQLADNEQIAKDYGRDIAKKIGH